MSLKWGERMVSVVSILVAAALFAALPAWAGNALDECWKESKDRGELGACLAERRDEGDAHLRRARSDARAAQAGLDAMTGVRQASRNLTRAGTAFTLYRELECHQQELQFGSGSGSGDAFTACWIDMTHDRIAALETLMPEGKTEIVAPGKLERTTWVAADIGGRQVAAGIESTVTFQGASEVTGNSGCNNFHATIKVEGKTVRLGPIALTRMMCRPVAMDQQGRFVAALESTRRLERRSGLLFAYAEGPDPLVRFWQREELPE